MELRLIKNPDASRKVVYDVARILYAETTASSLPGVEALASMIGNNARESNRDIADVVRDAELFEALNPRSARNKYLRVDVQNRGFQMCLRVAARMVRGGLPDSCHGATRFHFVEHMPDWAVSRGYIDDVDGMLFYL